MEGLRKKLSSGRYFLTIVGGLAFAYCVYKQSIEPQAIASILTMIFVSYFQKNREEK